MAFPAQPLRFDVSDVLGERASLAATYYPVRGAAATGAVLVCLPGGTYSREYWDLTIPGHRGYSFAEFATANGYAVVTIDPLGTGESSKPVRDFDFSDIAATLECAVSALPALTGDHGTPVAVAHSLGGYLAIVQQSLFSSYAGLAVLGCTNQHVAPLNLDPAFVARSATPQGRAELAQGNPRGSSAGVFRGPSPALAELVSPRRRAGRCRRRRFDHRKIRGAARLRHSNDPWRRRRPRGTHRRPGARRLWRCRRLPGSPRRGPPVLQ